MTEPFDLYIVSAPVIANNKQIEMFVAGVSREFVVEWSTSIENAMWFEKPIGMQVLNCVRLLDPSLSPTISKLNKNG